MRIPQPALALLFVPVFVVAVSVLRAQAPKPADAGDLPKLTFEKYTLPNGLDVILSEDHRLPMVAVNLWYHVGPANEEAGRTGFAHLFEHMMFQGTKHVPGDAHFKLLEGAGASDINGTTDFDRTNYFQTLPANQLELALWLESDRMGYLLDVLDQNQLSNQQDVVRNERRQSVENRPYGMVDEGLYHLLFPQGHPYYASVIGSHADIQAAQLDDVKKFFRQYYAPNNASLAIVGDIDKANARKLVEKYFGSLKRGPDVPKIAATTPPITAERRATITDKIQLPRVTMAWLTSPIFKDGDADADIASSVLGAGRSSRLYKSLVYDKQIAQNVLAYQQSLMLGSVFAIEVTARPGHTNEELEKAIDAELEKFRAEGPTDKEIERARNRIETQIIQGLETLGGFGGVADRLNSYNHFVGTPDYLATDVARYRKVTAATVRNFAQTQLRNAARAVVFAVPGEPDLGQPVPTPKADKTPAGAGAESVNAEEAFRKEPPKPAAARPLSLPVPNSFTLKNGLTIIHSQRPGLPVVAANLVLRTGSDANPINRPGLATFTATMLDQGTATRSALQMADDVAQIGATLTATANMDATFIAIRSLAKNFPAALDLLADVTLRPSFPQAEIDRQRASRLARLVQQKEDPNEAARVVMRMAIFGDKHPYGYGDFGTEASVKATTRDDMVAFWKQNFAPNNAALVVTGNIDAATLRSLAEKTFGAWPRGTPAKPSLSAAGTTPARLVLVDRPGAPQTQLRVAGVGTARSTPDYDALQVMNNTLGGMFSSRINMNLREDHGYTYGASSQFAYYRTPGAFVVATGVRTDVTAPAVSEMLNEIRKMRNTSVTEEELTLSKDSLSRSLPGDFETSAAAAGSFSTLFVYDLGLNYYEGFPARIQKVTTSQVQAAATKYLDPAKMIVIAVGDRAKIAPELEKMKLAPVEVRDADGNVVK
jgi:zinc protease